jgi:hypothetical protein
MNLPLENCDCLTAKYKHMLLTLSDEVEFKGELDFLQFNFCPFCGKHVERKQEDDLTEEDLRTMLQMRGACSRASCD